MPTEGDFTAVDPLSAACNDCEFKTLLVTRLTDPAFIKAVGEIVDKLADNKNPLNILKELVVEENKIVVKLLDSGKTNEMVSGTVNGTLTIDNLGDREYSVSVTSGQLFINPIKMPTKIIVLHQSTQSAW
jgi:hypothetical protein